jgi:type II secretory pathway pseudopilin PulG
MTGTVGADRRGFALPAVLLLVALLTVLLLSGLTRARGERQMAEASDETAVALTVAQSGLQTYLGTATAKPTDGDSTRINVIGGYANVVVHLVRQPADPAEATVYLVRSTGMVINPDSGPVPRARRTVAQFATWEIARIERPATLTTINGLFHLDSPSPQNEPTLNVSGVDQCGLQPPIPGIRTPQVTWGGPDPDTTIVGSPAGILIEAAASIVAVARIDWSGVLGTGLVPDYTSFQNGDATFPIQRVLGSLTISGTTSSSGLLVVRDDLTITGTSFSFDGIILVGGRIQFQTDSNVVRGLVMTGFNLNTQDSETGGNPSANERNTYLYYDSCAVQSTLARLAGLSPIRNAWLDTWESY